MRDEGFASIVRSLQQLHELVEEELGIRRSAGGLGVELGREPGVVPVADTLVRAVVHVDEQRFPIGAQGVVVHRITMVLAGDEAAVGAHLPHGLVVAAVSVLQLVDARSAGLRE